MSWAKQIIHWRTEDDIVNVSVAFTWDLPLAYKLCRWNTQAGLKVMAGGPAVDLMPHYLADVADCGGQMYPLPLARHNPDATFTTRGCIRRCEFCAVPKIEGEFRELTDWIPAPIVCDNNILASSKRHFETVIERLKPFRRVDFNQGLDARIFSGYHLNKLRELSIDKFRFSWDYASEESIVMAAIKRVRDSGFPLSHIRIYCLVNHGETQAEATFRLQALKDMGIMGFPMRYQKLDSLKKDDFVSPEWDATELPRFIRYWSKQVWLGHIPYADYKG